jgi:lipopolysaccharide export system protein LptA
MFTSQDPLQAQSKRMEAKNRGLWMRYEGGAAMWQGGNRIQADEIIVDRDKRTLTATGNVVTDIWEQPKKQAPSGSAAAVRTVVRAPRLIYTEADRLAYYTGGVNLTRPRLTVSSNELRAYLAESGADSSLDKAYADGAVQMVQKAPPDRTLTGTGRP